MRLSSTLFGTRGMFNEVTSLMQEKISDAPQKQPLCRVLTVRLRVIPVAKHHRIGQTNRPSRRHAG